MWEYEIVSLSEFDAAIPRLGARKMTERYGKKGSQIYAEGSLRTREWQDKNSNRQFTTEIVVRTFQLLDSRSQNNSGNNSQEQAYNRNQQIHSVHKPDFQNPPNPQATSKQDDFIEDNIPF